MSMKDRGDLKKWLESRSRNRRNREYRLDLDIVLNAEKS